MTTSPGIGFGTIFWIFPFVASLTHWLIRSGAAGVEKSSSAASASKYSFTVSRNVCRTGKPERDHTELPIAMSTVGSSPSRRSMRLRYEASISSMDRSPKPSAARICAKVSPAVPFMAIPSAIEADTGDRKTFSAAGTPARWRRSKAK